MSEVFAQATNEWFGNASSMHSAGQAARQRLEQARRAVAEALGTKDATEILFTSGGTEANNLAIRGVLRPGMHAVTTTIEHPSVLETLRDLEPQGVSVTYVPVTAQGVVEPSAIEAALRPDTALVSVMAANNETGALQPIHEIAQLVKAQGHRILFHSDGVQAAGRVSLGVDKLGVDLFTVSGHKLYAPKGVGALYVRKGLKLRPMQSGGRHERGTRAGTENVAGAIALAHAFTLCSAEERQRIAMLRDRFQHTVCAALPHVTVNAAGIPRLPNTTNLLFKGLSAETMLIALDMKGMCVSTGSACSSGSVEPSHVLVAMGLTVKDARSSLRISLGRFNTEADVDTLADALISTAHRMGSVHTEAREAQLA